MSSALRCALPLRRSEKGLSFYRSATLDCPVKD